MTESRRRFLQAGGAVAVLGALGIYTMRARQTGAVESEAFEVTHTDEEWKKILTPNQFKVLREAATERPYSSPLNDEHRHGVFSCAGCDLDLYSSETKFESGTGWPSFYQPLENADRHDARHEPRAWFAPPCTAGAAAAISATCSTTARSRRGFATA